MFDNRNLLILSELRRNARESLTNMSKRTHIPVSTIFEKLRNNNDLIRKHTTLLNFNRLGYNIVVNVLVKLRKDYRELLRKFLLSSVNVNSLYKVNNGYDFLFEGVFEDISKMECYMEHLEDKFKISGKMIFFMIEDLKRESFLEDLTSMPIGGEAEWKQLY